MALTNATASERQPSSALKKFLDSARVWLALMAYLVVVKLIMTFFLPTTFRDPTQALVFQWTSVVIWTLLGLASIWFAQRTGFPQALDERISHRQRFLVPVLIGLGFGLFSIVINLFTTAPTFNIPFPVSILTYSGAAIVLELIYLLLPVPLLLWLISNVILRKRGQEQVFWVLALLTAALEPLTQALALRHLGVGMGEIVGASIADYAGNVTYAFLFRKYGFLAPIVMRVAYYLVWHVVYGNFFAVVPH